MAPFTWFAAAVFLPLFPASMPFNWLFARVRNAWLRAALLLLWPQLGLALLAALAQRPPAWIVYWAALTAALYAFRALVLRDLALWTAYMATSAWSLLWAVATVSGDEGALVAHALGLSAPFLLLIWLVARLEAAFGAAYAGTCGGLAQTLPRLSLLLVIALLAAVGTPLFPSFFTLLTIVTRGLSVVPGVALMVLLVWLLWAWAGARMMRGMVVGPASAEAAPDLSGAGVVLAVVAVAGAAAAGYLL